MIKFVFKIRLITLMAKAKYRYNPHTLSYDKIELTLTKKILKWLMLIIKKWFKLTFQILDYII